MAVDDRKWGTDDVIGEKLVGILDGADGPVAVG